VDVNMSSQIQKKFIRNNAVDGTKLQLLSGQAIRIDTGMAEVELLKLVNNKAYGPQGSLATETQVEEARAYTDTAIAALVDSAPAVLDTLRELAEALNNDPDFSNTITGYISTLSSRVTATENKNTEQDGRLDSAESRITATESKNTEQDSRLTSVESKNTEQDSRLTATEAKDAEQDTRLDGIESTNEQQDLRLSATEAKDIEQDLEIADIESKNTEQDGRLDAVETKDAEQDGRLDSTETKNTEQDGRLTSVESKNTEQDGRLDSAESRLDDIEAATRVAYKARFIAATADLAYIDLPHNADANSLLVTVDRLVAFEGDDYTVSVVGGVTRITWINSLVSPGDEALAVGDYIGYQYYHFPQA
jgi:hypothetical protein